MHQRGKGNAALALLASSSCGTWVRSCFGESVLLRNMQAGSHYGKAQPSALRVGRLVKVDQPFVPLRYLLGFGVKAGLPDWHATCMRHVSTAGLR